MCSIDTKDSTVSLEHDMPRSTDGSHDDTEQQHPQSILNEDHKSALHQDESSSDHIVYERTENKAPVTSNLREHHEKTTFVKPNIGPQRHRIAIWRVWWLEIISCIAVLAALISMILVLHSADNKPLLQLPFHITVNTFIAIITAVLKKTATFVLAEGISQAKWSWCHKPRRLEDFAIYDNASRGPWGAVMMLWRLRLKPFIASFGAFLSLVLLIADPMSQQLISFADGSVNMPNMKTLVPRTQMYDEQGQSMGADINALAPGVRQAMTEGLFSSIKPEVPWTCETSNCTFSGEYSSVGYCSSCADVSNNLIQTGNITNGPVTVTLPAEFYNLTLTHNTTVLDGGESFAIRSFNNGTVGMIVFDPRASKGYTCNLYPCVHTFRSNVSSGRFTEVILNRSGPMSDMGPMTTYRAYVLADLRCLDITQPDAAQRRASLKQLGYDLDANLRWLPYNISVDPKSGTGSPQYSRPTIDPDTAIGIDTDLYQGDPGNRSLTDVARQFVPAQCLYQMQGSIPASIDQTLTADFFDGTLTDKGVYKAASGPPVAQAICQAAAGNAFGRIAFGNVTFLASNTTLQNVEDVMQNITDSMTTYIRWHGNSNLSEAATGVAEHYAVCVQVQWAYIAYMAALAVFVLFFFVAMTMETRIAQARAQRGVSMNGVPAYHDFKSSTAATLFHGLDMESQALLHDVGYKNRVEELDDKSKEVFVRLFQTDQGWKLSTVDRDSSPEKL